MAVDLASRIKFVFRFTKLLFRRFLGKRAQFRLLKNLKRECRSSTMEHDKYYIRKWWQWLYIVPLTTTFFAAGIFETLVLYIVSLGGDYDATLSMGQVLQLRGKTGALALLSIFLISGTLYSAHNACHHFRGVNKVEEIGFSSFVRRTSIIFLGGLIAALAGVLVKVVSSQFLPVTWLTWGIAAIPPIFYGFLVRHWSPPEREFYKKFYEVESEAVVSKLIFFHRSIAATMIAGAILVLYHTDLLAKADLYI